MCLHHRLQFIKENRMLFHIGMSLLKRDMNVTVVKLCISKYHVWRKVDELIKVIEETEYHHNEVQSIPLIYNNDMTMDSNKQTNTYINSC